MYAIFTFHIGEKKDCSLQDINGANVFEEDKNITVEQRSNIRL